MITRICRRCGNVLSDGITVCPKCGQLQMNMKNGNGYQQPDTMYGTNQQQDTIYYQEQHRQPSGSGGIGKGQTNILLYIIIALLVLALGFMALMLFQQKESTDKDMEAMSNKNDSIENAIKATQDSLQQINDSIEQAKARELAEAERKRKKEQIKRDALAAFKTFLNKASNNQDYTDENGWFCCKTGSEYYVYDINHDGIPEVFVKYEKYYYYEAFDNEAILDGYCYNSTKGKVQCIYNRLNKSTPYHKGNTIYIYGDYGYDKITYNSSKGKFQVTKDIEGSYPSGDTALEEHSIYNMEALTIAFGH